MKLKQNSFKHFCGAVVSQSQSENRARGRTAYRLQAKPAATAYWPVTKQPYAALACCLMVSTPVIHMDYYAFADLEGWKAKLACVGWPGGHYPRSGHMSYIDQA